MIGQQWDLECLFLGVISVMRRRNQSAQRCHNIGVKVRNVFHAQCNITAEIETNINLINFIAGSIVTTLYAFQDIMCSCLTSNSFTWPAFLQLLGTLHVNK